MQNLYEGVVYNDAQYAVQTMFKDDYDDIQCKFDEPNKTYDPRSPASGRSSVEGRVNLSTENGTLNNQFGHAK